MNEQTSYDRTRERLEEIVAQVKAKDVPLEKSLELYEEALRLGNRCAEMIDRTDFSAEELERASAREELGAEEVGEADGSVAEAADAEADGDFADADTSFDEAPEEADGFYEDGGSDSEGDIE
jgi:exodeoxyribonuclease VII small subunit